MSGSTGSHIIIVGGGASGVLLAYQLLHQPTRELRITLIEKCPEIGRGIAYHTDNPNHLLNVRVANMSALPDEPEHFWRWLASRETDLPPCTDPYGFVPRRIYGDYITSLLEQRTSDRPGAQRLSIVHGTCSGISEDKLGAAVTLNDGRFIVGDVVVLATGHDTRADSVGHTDPWAPPTGAPLDPDATILIRGTGLTMVDCVLTLLRDGHRGPIIAMSRRGLLAKSHRRIDALHIEEDDVPFGVSLSQLLRWFRENINRHTAKGGDWRAVIDGLRPYTQRIWHELPLSSKRRFLEHGRAWWDVHRHRMAPDADARITQALNEGRLILMAAKVTGTTLNDHGVKVDYRRRSDTKICSMQVGRIFECTGIFKDPRSTTNPVMLSLFDRGLARVDPLCIGIETDRYCAIINRNGAPSRRLFAVGPLTRAAFWEIVAIPDIRNQCAVLAAFLACTATGRRVDLSRQQISV
jgi:uncharacterized NAD(P)/FAD-binding protein YdhS